MINTNLLKSLMELLKSQRSFVKSIEELEALDQERFLSKLGRRLLRHFLSKLLLKHIFE